MDLPPIGYNRAGLSTLSKDYVKHRNTLRRYGDGTAELLFTALAELKMSGRFLEEWKLYTADTDCIPPSDTLVKFVDDRELIIGTAQRDKPRDSHLSNSRTTSKTSQNTCSCKGRNQVTLHAAQLDTCNYCKTERLQLYNYPKFRQLDVSQRRQALHSIHACFNCSLSQF